MELRLSLARAHGAALGPRTTGNHGQQRRTTVSRPCWSAAVSERSPRSRNNTDCLSHGGSQRRPTGADTRTQAIRLGSDAASAQARVHGSSPGVDEVGFRRSRVGGRGRNHGREARDDPVSPRHVGVRSGLAVDAGPGVHRPDPALAPPTCPPLTTAPGPWSPRRPRCSCMSVWPSVAILPTFCQTCPHRAVQTRIYADDNLRLLPAEQGEGGSGRSARTDLDEPHPAENRKVGGSIPASAHRKRPAQRRTR